MPDAPEKPLDPKAIKREKEAKRNSKPYRRVHPTITVWVFENELDYNDQRRVDKEAEQIEADLRRYVAATPEKPAHWLVRKAKADDWQPE